jgi:hypothetical protein
MSRPAAAASLPLPFELVVEDGIPMENNFHVLQASLLRELVIRLMSSRRFPWAASPFSGCCFPTR